MKFLQWHAMRELLGGQGVVQGLRPFPSQLCISKPKHATEVPLQLVHHALKVWVFSMHTNLRRRTIVTLWADFKTYNAATFHTVHLVDHAL